MTRIAWVADLHIANHGFSGGAVVGGLNRRARDCLAVLGRAVSVAYDQGCKAFVVLGDLFDGPRPSPPLIAAAQQEFQKARELGMEVILLVGNHDRSSAAPGDHALAPLAPVATVVERPQVLEVAGVQLLCWPYVPGPAPLQGFDEAEEAALRLSAKAPRIVAMHAGIRDEETPAWLQRAGIHRQVLYTRMAELGAKRCMAGDWHKFKAFGLPDGGWCACQVGTLCPAGWDDEGTHGYGNVIITDEEQIATISNVPGPRFIDRAGAEGPSARGYVVYARETCPPAEVAERTTFLQGFVDSGFYRGFRVETDEAEATAQARSAADAARSAKGLAEAVDGYVAAMPLEVGEDRTSVLGRARGYLKL